MSIFNEEPFLIAIDAALSNKNNIGKIIVTPNGMNVGRGLNKKSIYVGDISIKGIVTKDFKNPKYNFKFPQTRLNKLTPPSPIPESNDSTIAFSFASNPKFPIHASKSSLINASWGRPIFEDWI